VNNSTPLPAKTDVNNYRNLKAQCYDALANKINSRKIGVNFDNNTFKESLIEELEQVKRKDADKDGKFQIIGKDEVKENIGRSPDFSDCMMMRMHFLIGSWEVKVFEDTDGLVFG